MSCGPKVGCLGYESKWAKLSQSWWLVEIVLASPVHGRIRLPGDKPLKPTGLSQDSTNRSTHWQQTMPKTPGQAPPASMVALAAPPWLQDAGLVGRCWKFGSLMTDVIIFFVSGRIPPPDLQKFNWFNCFEKGFIHVRSALRKFTPSCLDHLEPSNWPERCCFFHCMTSRGPCLRILSNALGVYSKPLAERMMRTAPVLCTLQEASKPSISYLQKTSAIFEAHIFSITVCLAHFGLKAPPRYGRNGTSGRRQAEL